MNGSSSGSDRLAHQRRRGALSWLAGLLLPLALLLVPGLEASAATGAVGASLQEVAPPGAVRQLQQALAERAPTLQILEPADDSLMPDGPWTLKLGVDDWPLVDAGPLGLGPHLVVQLDDQPARRLTSLETRMPALSPGSHRLTVFAARPWGEAVKNPGAVRQIRLHRVAANPASLPARGTPQLIAVSPSQPSPAEPLLLDWLLIDAPLQNFRSGDTGWRLRVTVNGDSFLVDRQTPLWLKGWRPGLNALQLELLDGRGEPLNLPFNSLVSEVELDRSAPAPAWRSGALLPLTLAQLIGEAPLPAEAAAASPAAAPPASPPPGDQASPPSDQAPTASAERPFSTPQDSEPAAAARRSEAEPTELPAGAPAPQAAQEPPSRPETDRADAPASPATEPLARPDLEALPPARPSISPADEASRPVVDPGSSKQDRLPPAEEAVPPEPDALPPATADSLPPATADSVRPATDDAVPQGATRPLPLPEAATAPVDEPPAQAGQVAASEADPTAAAASQTGQPAADETPPERQPAAAAEAAAAAARPADATAAAASPPPTARELVNPDGTLIQPQQPSLLSALRRRFGR